MTNLVDSFLTDFNQQVVADLNNGSDACSQPQLHIRIPWGASSKSQCPDPHARDSNPASLGWGLGNSPGDSRAKPGLRTNAFDHRTQISPVPPSTGHCQVRVVAAELWGVCWEGAFWPQPAGHLVAIWPCYGEKRSAHEVVWPFRKSCWWIGFLCLRARCSGPVRRHLPWRYWREQQSASGWQERQDSLKLQDPRGWGSCTEVTAKASSCVPRKTCTALNSLQKAFYSRGPRPLDCRLVSVHGLAC